MKIFILENVEKLTHRYHSDGGLVIIAKNIEQAKKIISEDKNIKPTEEEWNKAIVYNILDNVNSTYYVFPDAGCC